MLDTIQLQDFQNNVDEYLYRVRTGKCYYLKDKTTGRAWFLKPYKEPQLVTITVDLEPETVKHLNREAKAKKLTFDQMVTYVLLKHIDRIERLDRIIKKRKPVVKAKKAKKSSKRK